MSTEDFDVSAELAPLSGLDEFLIHNNQLPVRVMATSDPKAFERVWFSAIDPGSGLLVVVGFGVYPNLGTTDAFALANLRGRHITVRAQAPMGMNRMRSSLGPIGLEIIHPFQEWRLSLDENDFGISFDLHWFDEKRAVFNSPLFIDQRMQYVDAATGYECFGSQSGWVRVGEETITLDRSVCVGSRDHHWGVRDNVGGPPEIAGPMAKHVHTGEFVDFGDFAVFGGMVQYKLGDPRKSDHVVRSTRALDFEAGTNMLAGGEAALELASGEMVSYSFEKIGNQVAHLRCGMYGGVGGSAGTPNEGFYHGMRVNELTITGDDFDTTDRGVRSRLCGLDQTVAHFRRSDGVEAYGLTETVNTVTFDKAVARRRGLSVRNMLKQSN